MGGTKITRANDESPFSQEFPAHSDAGEAAVSYTYTWAADEAQKSGSHFDLCLFYFVFMNTVSLYSSLSAMNLHISSLFLKHFLFL